MQHSIIRKSLVLVTSLITAGAAQPFEITWSSVDGGGAMRSSGGSFVLSGTIGQPDAGAMAGGSFRLNGGFWYETPPGDCNASGAADLLDFQSFITCWMGPGANVDPACPCFDVQGDQAIDLADFAEMQNSFASQ